VNHLVKEKVKCRDCGKEGEVENTIVQKDFFIHWDEKDREYFLCTDCDNKQRDFYRELEDEDEGPCW